MNDIILLISAAFQGFIFGVGLVTVMKWAFNQWIDTIENENK